MPARDPGRRRGSAPRSPSRRCRRPPPRRRWRCRARRSTWWRSGPRCRRRARWGGERSGVAKVLSTTSGTPAACATSAIARRSGTSSEGCRWSPGTRRASVVDRGRDRVRIVAREGGVDAEPRERVTQQSVGAAVQRRGHDRVARLGEVEQRERLRRLAARGGDRRDAALQVRDAPLEGVAGRVHDARVDVAELPQPEQLGGVVRPVEHVRGGGVDRDGPRAGGRVGALLRRVHRTRPQPVLPLRFQNGAHRLLPWMGT
jgi:hypothetical protein